MWPENQAYEEPTLTSAVAGIPLDPLVRPTLVRPITDRESEDHRREPWYEAYLSALFEPDRTRMLEKIKLASKLIINREREVLGHQEEHQETKHRETAMERAALNRAVHALRALLFCQNL